MSNVYEVKLKKKLEKIKAIIEFVDTLKELIEKFGGVNRE